MVEGFEPPVDSRLKQFSRLPMNRRKGNPGQALTQIDPAREALCGAVSAGQPAPKASPTDPDLAAVVAAWPTLPEALRAGIVAMVRAAGDVSK